MGDFVLDKRLDGDTVHVCDLELSEVRLMKDSRYEWVVLVPMVADAEEVFDLSNSDYNTLNEEIKKVASALKQEFNPTKINIGALGNIVRQLHIHIICRNDGDYAWPGPVWGSGEAVPYSEPSLKETVEKVKNLLT